MMATLKRTLFREPRAGGMAGWLWYVFGGVGATLGCLMFVNGLFFSDFSSIGGPSYSPMLAALGSTFFLQFTAELLPKAWSTVAGIMRAGAISVALVSLLLIVVF